MDEAEDAEEAEAVHPQADNSSRCRVPRVLRTNRESSGAQGIFRPQDCPPRDLGLQSSDPPELLPMRSRGTSGQRRTRMHLRTIPSSIQPISRIRLLSLLTNSSITRATTTAAKNICQRTGSPINPSSRSCPSGLLRLLEMRKLALVHLALAIAGALPLAFRMAQAPQAEGVEAGDAGARVPGEGSTNSSRVTSTIRVYIIRESIIDFRRIKIISTSRHTTINNSTAIPCSSGSLEEMPQVQAQAQNPPKAWQAVRASCPYLPPLPLPVPVGTAWKQDCQAAEGGAAGEGEEALGHKEEVAGAQGTDRPAGDTKGEAPRGGGTSRLLGLGRAGMH